MLELIQTIDINILNGIRANLTNPYMDKFMVFISSLGNLGSIWIVLGIFLICIKKYRKVGVVLLVSLIITSILGEGIIKNIVQRPRPFLLCPNINLIIKAPMSYSFPSGHTASSFVAAFVLGNYFKDKRYIFLIFAALMGFSRMYLFVHYPSDVIAGIILGFIGYKITNIFSEKIFNKNYCRINRQ